MSTLRNVTLDSGNLIGGGDAFDSAVVDGGHGSCDAAAALANSIYGFKIIIADTNEVSGTIDITAPASNIIRCRYHFDPNALFFNDAWDNFQKLYFHSTGPTDYIIRAYLNWTGALYRLDCYTQEDDATGHTVCQSTFSDAEHYIEFCVEKASSDVAGDGRVRVWIGGVLKGTKENLDNWDLFAGIDYLKLGAIASIEADTSGTMYIDEIKLTDTDEEIGPSTTAGVPIFSTDIHSTTFGKIVR